MLIPNVYWWNRLLSSYFPASPCFFLSVMFNCITLCAILSWANDTILPYKLLLISVKSNYKLVHSDWAATFCFLPSDSANWDNSGLQKDFSPPVTHSEQNRGALLQLPPIAVCGHPAPDFTQSLTSTSRIPWSDSLLHLYPAKSKCFWEILVV